MGNEMEMELECGCVKHTFDLSVYGDATPFYKIDRQLCTNNHNKHMMTTDVCSCFIKYNVPTETINSDVAPIKMIMFACTKQCSVKLNLKMNYPNYWTYYQLLTLKPDYSFDEINEKMYDFIHVDDHSE
jgi:hypothetical protein